MAHFVVEYSDNLGVHEASIHSLLEGIHQCAIATGIFPKKGIRSRAYCCTNYRLADGNPKHGFVHMELKLGIGRTEEEKQYVAEKLFEVLCDHFKSSNNEAGLAISFEVRELSALKFNLNNVANYL